jgi:hypothetical protein
MVIEGLEPPIRRALVTKNAGRFAPAGSAPVDTAEDIAKANGRVSRKTLGPGLLNSPFEFEGDSVPARIPGS